MTATAVVADTPLVPGVLVRVTEIRVPEFPEYPSDVAPRRWFKCYRGDEFSVVVSGGGLFWGQLVCSDHNGLCDCKRVVTEVYAPYSIEKS